MSKRKPPPDSNSTNSKDSLKLNSSERDQTKEVVLTVETEETNSEEIQTENTLDVQVNTVEMHDKTQTLVEIEENAAEIQTQDVRVNTMEVPSLVEKVDANGEELQIETTETRTVEESQTELVQKSESTQTEASLQ